MSTLKPGLAPKKKLKRSVTRFIDEANIEESEQLDLAEFILAAHYLGTEANDEQLMEVFVNMEEEGPNENETAKDTIKRLITNVEDKFGLSPVNEDIKENDDEVMAVSPLDSMGEDSNWQDNKLDGFLAGAYEDQNLSIASNLLLTTALSPEQIADITGVDVKKLEALLEDEESGSDYETDEEDFSDEETTESVPKTTNESKTEEKPQIIIKSEKFNKEVSLTTQEMNILDSIINGGIEAIKTRPNEVLSLLKKLKKAIGLSPQGMKKMKTVRRLQVFSQQFDKQTKETLNKETTEVESSKKEERNRRKNVQKAIAIIIKSERKNIPKEEIREFLLNRNMPSEDIDEAFRQHEEKEKFPRNYRVVIHPGALVKEGSDLKSKEVSKIPQGTLCIIEEIQGRRARLSSPVVGWCSVVSGDKRNILQRDGSKTPEMAKALQADRANETKIQILKSVTTLNDKTVRRILEKSDWNLRRAIDAFYVAKFQTQKYIKDKESKQTNESNGNTTNKPNKPQKKKGFWKSWKKFADNS